MLRCCSSITTYIISFALLAVAVALSSSSTVKALAVSTPATDLLGHQATTRTSLGMTSAEASPSATPNTAISNDDDDGSMRFGKFLIPEASIFCHAPLSSSSSSSSSKKAFAFVNLRPIVRGHVLVAPTRVVPHMSDLTTEEYTELWGLVRDVQSVLRRAYPGTTAFNVAVQDGRAAGQSVPHVHIHLLPRTEGDLERNDDVYDALEAWAPTESMAASKGKTDIDVPDDADRVDRTLQMMADEAAVYRGFATMAEGAPNGEDRDVVEEKKD